MASTTTREQVKVGRLTVALSNTGKVLFPDDGITKGDLIGYYQAAAEHMLPYLRERPLAMARYPDGITGERIFQKNVGRHFPDWIRRVEVGKEGGQLCQVVATKAADLVYLANQACIELHPFLSRVERPASPVSTVTGARPARRTSCAGRTCWSSTWIPRTPGTSRRSAPWHCGCARFSRATWAWPRS